MTATVGVAGVITAAAPARAEDCPGNPDAIGTSRVIQIDPADYARIGAFQYSTSLPLEDHEVVLTFDDGPLPPHTTHVLDALAAQCVKANFFLVGEMARNFPAVVRRIYQDGHVIGTHSEDHPLRFGQLPIEKMRWEIDKGIADVTAALGDPAKVAPFFRIPGFARSDAVEDELAERKLAVFSTDTVEDDWHRHISPKQIISLALSRLEKRGRGMLLLHDIHPWTAAALPELLKELKDHGFHIVQVQPTPESVAAAIDAESELTVAWTPAQQDAMDGANAPIWPALVPAGQSGTDTVALPIADAALFDAGRVPASVADTGRIETASADESGPSPRLAGWPQLQQDEPAADSPASGEQASDQPALPAPALADIGWPVRAERVVEPLPAALAEKEETRARGARHLVRHARVEDHEGAHRHEGGRRHTHTPTASKEHAGLAATLAALFTPARTSEK